ncbi:MAG: response regulator transcription factor [Phycisphaerales bacterium]|jgi:two-component system, OmpR family, phosphate regulon response regulator PhoB|nr:response regulator transcription factor [Phycisphaerales bacterium]MBT7171489.1 response regulator transcription factor [Phycisphaerales bacterium]
MSQTATILIVDEDQALCELLAAQLRQEGYVVSFCGDGVTGFAALREQVPMVLLMAQGLLGPSGAELLAEIRNETTLADLPVMVLSAEADAGDEVLALLGGADDYLAKPFVMPVLKARVAALLRRSRQSQPPEKDSILIAGPVRVDLHRHQIEISGQGVSLTRTEFKLLAALIEGRGRVFDRDLLIDKALGADAIVTDRTIDVHITSLRKKLGDARWLVETVRGVGYRLSEGS